MEHETVIRLGVFLGLFALLSLAEVLIPRRARAHARKGRWLTNWGIILTSTAGLRLLALALPLLAVGAAIDAPRRTAGAGLEWQDDRPSRLGWSLILPFARK
ncbi:hypothetical protein [Pseudosulfitobacter koreensis]|uniref:Uncharacterized protein n=1 Tax=Pseudosulfitobacter koreensis TaxID=2968472 RepID=A0ABT1YYP5_9RHOB|nr:hypothetical protein [Pseudosulfitobacter koreense]MCR8826009.1 hypothetical protein [Pseudosulfitobacter koreense]